MSVTPNRTRSWQPFAHGGAFALRRLVTAVIALIGVTLIVFLLSHAVGDPAYLLVGQNGTPAQLAKVRAENGFNRPLLLQYLSYLGGLFRGDFGTSLYNHKPVLAQIGEHFPATLELSVAAMILGVVFTVPLGVAAAVKPGSLWDRIATGSVRFGVAMPAFWLGLILIYVFVYVLHIMPSPTGELDITTQAPPTVTGLTVVDAAIAGQWDTFGNALWHLVLPAVTLALTSFSALLALTQSVMRRILGSDYMRTARASGLPRRIFFGRYAFKNAASPIVSQIAMTFGYLLGGTVLVETVFAWPGIGQYSVLSMQRLDFPPVLGVAVLSAAIYLTLYFVADLIALAIDPRIRHDS